MPIIWALVPIVGRKKPAKIGICTFAWRAVEKGSLLSWFTFKPESKGPIVQINKSLNRCSAKNHCLALSCPLNETTFDSYCDFHHEPEWYRPKLEKKWQKLIQSMANFVEAAEKCKEAYAKDPNIRVIDFTDEKYGVKRVE